MKRIQEVIVVEGRYDKNTLSQVVEAAVVTLEGFSIFHDKEKLAFLRDRTINLDDARRARNEL